MVTLPTKLEIIQMHMTGQSNRSIAKDTGLNRKTVNKYVREYEDLQVELKHSFADHDVEAIRDATEAIVSAPKYKNRTSPGRKWNAEMDEVLDGILAAEEDKRTRLKTSKQQMTKLQIHQRLRELGFDIGYTTVCEKINEKRHKSLEAFIAQSYEFGDRFEYDFGEVHLEIAGKLTKVFMAVMTAPASKYRFALLYTNQRYEVFVDSQVRFFEHMGGCFCEGVYDNMRNVVSKFIGKNEKLINPKLLQLAAYYGFKVNVTNCFAGNEKGSVESAVKVTRKAAFATHWQFSSLEEAQRHLDSVLERLNADCPAEDERAALSAYRPPFEAADIRAGVNVDKYSCIRFDKVSYSVPDYLVGKKVTLKAYPNEIIAIVDGREVARHVRLYESGKMVLDINHYLPTLLKKPGAVARSSALCSQAALQEVFKSDYADNPREFISILSACQGFDVEHTIEALKAHTAPKRSSEGCSTENQIVKQTLSQIELIAHMVKEVA